MENKTLAGRFEVKFAGTDAQTITGLGAVFGNSDAYGDIIEQGAFADTLARHKAAGTMPAMFLNHNSAALPIGIWQSMSEDAVGLQCSGQFIATTTGNDAYTAAKAGAVTGLSIGYIVTGYEMRGNNRVITAAELIEVSLVTFPANDLARVQDVKNKEPDMQMNEMKTLLLELKALAEANAATLLEIKQASKSEGVDEDGNECDCEFDDDCECDDEDKSEAKYNAAIISAVETLSLKLKQERNGR